MNNPNDGGPAFPGEAFASQHNPGMSTRTWLAGKALEGLLSNAGVAPPAKVLAAACVEAADAVLEALKKPTDQ